VGKAANLYTDGGYQLSGSSYVVEKYLGNTWLWDKVLVCVGLLRLAFVFGELEAAPPIMVDK
jgi:hypothetical protein